MKFDEYVLPGEGPLKRTRPFLAVCEGFGDVRFVSALLVQNGLTVYDVGCPTQARGFGDGKDAIPKYLQAVASDKRGLRGLTVIVDADDDPDKAFGRAIAALDSARFSPPSKPFDAGGSDIRIGVFIVPGHNKKGTLEHLLLEAAVKRNPDMKQCLDVFSDCTGSVKSWAPNQQAKMKIAALVAAFCENNPSCSLAWVWGEKGNPIPLDSDCFGELVAFLSEFSR